MDTDCVGCTWICPHIPSAGTMEYGDNTSCFSIESGDELVILDAGTVLMTHYSWKYKESFRSFVRVMSSAVGERTPYNGSHTRHMAQYGDRFIDFLNARGEGMAFSPAQKDELLMRVWLHDIGKLVTPWRS